MIVTLPVSTLFNS